LPTIRPEFEIKGRVRLNEHVALLATADIWR
jgi:hypothetical protein